MASTTVSQFRKLFPASVAPSSMLNGKVKITFKLKSYWGDKTVAELAKFVDILDVPDRHLHLYQIKKGCIAVICLCSITDAQKLKGGTWRASSALQMMGVSELYIGVVPMQLCLYSLGNSVISQALQVAGVPGGLAEPGTRILVAVMGTLIGTGVAVGTWIVSKLRTTFRYLSYLYTFVRIMFL